MTALGIVKEKRIWSVSVSLTKTEHEAISIAASRLDMTKAALTKKMIDLALPYFQHEDN